MVWSTLALSLALFLCASGETEYLGKANNTLRLVHMVTNLLILLKIFIFVQLSMQFKLVGTSCIAMVTGLQYDLIPWTPTST